MNNLNLDDTIAAISTPLGEGGIGIVRISGKEALRVADKIFLSKDRRRPSRYRSFSIHYGYIIGKNQKPESSPSWQSGAGKGNQKLGDRGLKKLKANIPHQRENGIIDEVLLTVMRRPRTYTKEDIVEINCHGGIVPLQKILDLVIKHGARLANPGEFTLRAFLNGRIDLTQAEAVSDIVMAKTEKSLELACRQLEGGFSALIRELSRRLLDVYTRIEAELDFPEEDLGFASREKTIKEIKKIKEEINELLNTSERGMVFKEGILTAICGRPNTGKSSLMNVLLNKNRCLVSHCAGTTRDTIEELADIRGVPLRLIDTAGITHPENSVEKEAVERSRGCLKLADLVLLILDGSRRLSKEDEEIIASLGGKPRIILLNKTDLPEKIEIHKVKKILPKDKYIKISCLTQKGINQLEKRIRDLILGGRVSGSEGCMVTNLRHKEALLKTKLSLGRALEGFRNGFPAEFIALDLKEGLDSLGEILGENIREGLLERIFSRFCVGK